jgi:Gpi18-like mannosyltransferase
MSQSIDQEPARHWMGRFFRWLRASSTRDAFEVALITRLADFAVGYISVITIGHAPSVTAPSNEFINLPDRWDASWYVGLAHGGYRWEGPGHHFARIAFFPAYPLSLRATAAILRLPDTGVPWLWTGVALSTLFFWLGLAYVYKITARLAGDAAAIPAITLLAMYPFAMFFGQVYSESLFLLAAAGSVYYLLERQFVGAISLGIVAGLCRPTGCLVTLMLASAVFRSPTRDEKTRLPDTVLRWISVLSPLIGTLVFSLYVKHLTGTWLAWMTEQAGWGREMRDVWQLAEGIRAFVSSNGFYAYSVQHPYELLNAFAAIFALATVVPIARRMGLGFGLFVLLSVIAPLRVGGLASMGRYTCVLFPIFVWMASVYPQRRVPLMAATFAMGQALMAALFFTDRSIY